MDGFVKDIVVSKCIFRIDDCCDFVGSIGKFFGYEAISNTNRYAFNKSIINTNMELWCTNISYA